MKILLLIASFFFGVCYPIQAHAIKLAPRVSINAKGSILRGDAQAFTGIGSVDRKEVFETIPAYKQIKRERLNRTDPRYYFLLAKANRDFNNLLEQVCNYYKLDLIAESGSISATGIRVFDLTNVMKGFFEK